ncbi:MAG: energy transducer TonB [Rhizomicrobium sp.]
MNMQVSGEAFDMDTGHPLARFQQSQAPASNRIGAILITVIAHIVVLAGLVFGVHTARIVQPQAITVHLDPVKKKLDDLAPPPPALTKPAVVTMPPPEVMIETTPSPFVAAPAPPAPSPPTVPTPAHATGEGRNAFIARLLDQLNRFKRYPPEARKAHIEGTVMLHFVMDPDGRVLSFEIAKSSGRPVLDNEALALIQRAQPLPPLPAGMNKLDAIVPIEFSLND